MLSKISGIPKSKMRDSIYADFIFFKARFAVYSEGVEKGFDYLSKATIIYQSLGSQDGSITAFL